jgi:hydrogenase-4 membrane subunit HyfE
MIPWVLRHTVSAEVYRTREIGRVLNIPSSLLMAAVLIVLSYGITDSILRAVDAPFARINVPLGLAVMFLGVFHCCCPARGCAAAPWLAGG